MGDQEPCRCWPMVHSSRRYDRFVTSTASPSKGSFWTQLWRKLKRERKKMTKFQCCAESVSMRFGYDSNSYLQNFDQGDNDRDDLSRSFSARFAVPSAVFEKNSH